MPAGNDPNMPRVSGGVVQMNKPGTLQEIIKAYDRAMENQGVPELQRTRVRNIVLYGSPDGF